MRLLMLFDNRTDSVLIRACALIRSNTSNTVYLPTYLLAYLPSYYCENNSEGKKEVAR